jgi:hypothetical protein
MVALPTSSPFLRRHFPADQLSRLGACHPFPLSFARPTSIRGSFSCYDLINSSHLVSSPNNTDAGLAYSVMAFFLVSSIPPSSSLTVNLQVVASLPFVFRSNLLPVARCLDALAFTALLVLLAEDDSNHRRCTASSSYYSAATNGGSSG